MRAASYLFVMIATALVMSLAIWNERDAYRADLAACRSELAGVRDSLATERADLIACYQSKGALEMAKADRVFSTPHLWGKREVTIIGAADSQGIARSIRVDRLGRVVVSPCDCKDEMRYLYVALMDSLNIGTLTIPELKRRVGIKP